MAKRGLSKEVIILEAKDEIRETGYENFSLRGLARRLGIKTASLYNHIDNYNELREGIIILVLQEMTRKIREEIDKTNGKDALLKFAVSYRSYAKQFPNLYQMIMMIPNLHSDKLNDCSFAMMNELYTVLKEYYPVLEDRVHFARMFRSGIHGFINLEQAGYFSLPQANVDDSFRYLTYTLADCLTVPDHLKQ